MSDCDIAFLGVRGTAPAPGAPFARYGGATSCVLVTMGGQRIFLDAGSGLLAADPRLPQDSHAAILLSHGHLDHIMGLPAFDRMYEPGFTADIYAAEHEGFGAREQLAALMRHPVWPNGVETFSPGVRFHTVSAAQSTLGSVTVDWRRGNHPGGCSLIRLTGRRRRLVYATDYEHSEETDRVLVALARGCDLLIYDAHYTPGEYERHRGWGHSTWRHGLTLATEAGVGQCVFYHHRHNRTDDELDAMQAELDATGANAHFARCGEELKL